MYGPGGPSALEATCGGLGLDDPLDAAQQAFEGSKADSLPDPEDEDDQAPEASCKPK